MTRAALAHDAHVESFAFAAVYRVRCLCGFVSEFSYTESDADRILGEHQRVPEAVWL